MSQRLRLLDFRASRGPRVLGICSTDYDGMASYVNTAQRRLLFDRSAGDESWWGTWAEIAFTGVSRTTPYITCPREVARIEKWNVCNRPVQSYNQFYEYLDFGNGRMPKLPICDSWPNCTTRAMDRNNVVTFGTQTIKPAILRIYPVNPLDSGAAKRVLLQGMDSSDTQIYTEDNGQNVKGEFVTIATPFADSVYRFNSITGIQKDVTLGDIQIFEVDPTTGDENLLHTMQPSETTAWYRRYYINNLPINCCGNGDEEDVTVTAIAKLEPIPVMVDTDYLLIQNLEAIIEECIAVRMSEMDNRDAQELATIHHVNAIRMLNSEITHYLGKQNPSVNFAPFGSARLERQNIGTMI